jgi:hypothetical protein
MITSDISQTSGVSVLRDAAGNDEFHATYALLKAGWADRGKDEFLDGFYTVEARRLRYFDQGRLTAVYDTGLPDRPHHADLMSAGTLRRKQLERAVRDQIGDSFVSATEFRGGVLARLMRNAAPGSPLPAVDSN